MRLMGKNSLLGIGLAEADPQAPLHLWQPPSIGQFTKLIQLSTDPVSPLPLPFNNGFTIAFNAAHDIRLKQHERANLLLEGPGGGLMIATDGNIGMGTELPAEKLHVAGGNMFLAPTMAGTSSGSMIFNNNSNINNSWGIERVSSLQESGLNFWNYRSTVPAVKFFFEVLFLTNLF
jgi:hypothetical protein